MNTDLEILRGMTNILNEASEAYYNTGEPIMSDEEFDERLNDLKEFEKELGIVLSNSPSINVGAKVLTELNEVKHNHPMLSLEKVHSVEELIKFAENKELVASIKLDGLSVSLLYESGNLIRAETRGNGSSGSDVTEHIKQFLNVPMKITKTDRYVIDGEAIIRDEDFEKVNENLHNQNKEALKNSRNAASGSLSVLDTSIVKDRRLSFFAWDIIEGGEYDSLYENLYEASELGFDIVPNYRFSSNKKDIFQKVIDTVFICAEEEGFPCDGVVLKFNDIIYGKSLGSTSHHLKNGVAYKKKNEEYRTKLKDIEWSMGKTGVLSPVAIFDSVDIGGSTIERASLSNVSVLENTLGDVPYRGQVIYISKRNEVIPYVERAINVEEINIDSKKLLAFPNACPVCGGETNFEKANNTEILVCTNPNCKGKLLGKLTHFVSKQAMNIDGMSESTINRFINKGYLCKFTDIYLLKSGFYEKIIKMDGFGKKSTDKLMDAIEKSKHTTLDRFINALSIPMVGKENAKLIAKHCNYNIRIFLEYMLSPYDWDKIDGIGSVVSDNINMYALAHYDEVKELASYMTFKKPTVVLDSVLKDSVFINKIFVITGSLNVFANRDEAKAKIESIGGKVSGSVSSKTDYLVNNDINSTSGKNKKAKELGVEIITENELINMLGGI